MKNFKWFDGELEIKGPLVRCDQSDGLVITDRENRKLLPISTHGKNSISCVHFAGKHKRRRLEKYCKAEYERPPKQVNKTYMYSCLKLIYCKKRELQDRNKG